MKFVYLFVCLLMTSFAVNAEPSCVTNIGRGACTFFPQTTITIDRPLGLTIKNEEVYEATFNKTNDKFDDLLMPFTVESTTGDPIAYSLTVLNSSHECVSIIDEMPSGDSTPLSVALAIDGVSVVPDEALASDGFTINREHQLMLQFADDHKISDVKRVCSGQIQIQAELAEL